ncbi:unnamed protein product [Aureobasidium pullulans]|nr:unnamed protein product [Aureobasidium pullulans]
MPAITHTSALQRARELSITRKTTTASQHARLNSSPHTTTCHLAHFGSSVTKQLSTARKTTTTQRLLSSHTPWASSVFFYFGQPFFIFHFEHQSSFTLIINLHRLSSSTFIIDFHHRLSSSTFIIDFHHRLSSSTFIIDFHHRLSSSTFIIDFHHRLSSSTFIINLHHIPWSYIITSFGLHLPWSTTFTYLDQLSSTSRHLSKIFCITSRHLSGSHWTSLQV